MLLSLPFLLVGCTAQPQGTVHSDMEANHVLLQGDTVSGLGRNIWYIFQDHNNNYWFGSDGEGLYRYDGLHCINFTTEHGLPNNRVRQIQEDHEGNMYFSTLDGICRFDGKRFELLEAIKSDEWKSEPNDLWFYMLGKQDESGPYRYDGKQLYNLEFPKHYLHDEFMANGINPFFSPYEIYSIYKDRSGSMWFGTSVFGACRFDGTSIKWMYEKDLTIVPAGGSFGIRSIFEDREGHFWLCNTNQRFLFDWSKTAQSDRLEYTKTQGVGDASTFGGDACIYFSHIVEDENGWIWLTTWDQGVYAYDGNQVRHYPVKDGSSTVQLVSMYKDRQGRLWLGTAEKGVYCFDGSNFNKWNK